jgi:hypothetical protein
MLSGNRKSGGTARRKTQIEDLQIKVLQIEDVADRRLGSESIHGVVTF